MSAPVDDAPRTVGPDRPARRTHRTAYLVALLLVALLAAGLLVWQASAARGPASAPAAAANVDAPANVAASDAPADRAARAALLAANTRALTTMTSVDPTDTDTVLRRWLGISTGALNANLRRSGGLVMQGIRNSHLRTAGTVRKATVVQLDPKSTSATVLTLVDVRLTVGSAAPTTRQDAIRTTLAKTGQDWKLTGITGNSLLGH